MFLLAYAIIPEREKTEQHTPNLQNFMAYEDYSVSDEYLHMLLQSEIKQSFDFTNWVKFARFDAISSILKNSALFGFQCQTAYLAITYFYRFLSIREIDNEKTWAIRLLSLACLSLAAKMEECKVPALSEFRFDENGDYVFTTNVIQRMELVVLNTLEWRMNCVTPFNFLHSFINRFSTTQVPSSSSTSVVISSSIELILDFIKEDVNSIGNRPSVIAAAAALVALDSRLTKQALELKINSIVSLSSSSLCEFLPIDDIYLLYETMQKQEQERMPRSIIVSPDLSPIRFDRSESSINTKRKRLTFADDNQNDGLPDEKQRRL